MFLCSWHHDCVLLSLLDTLEWKSFHGRVIGVNFYTLPNLCEISPEGPSPSCHLGDGYTDLVIVKECSRLQMNSHIQRNFNSKDQVSFCFNFSPFLRTVGTIIFIQIFLSSNYTRSAHWIYGDKQPMSCLPPITYHNHVISNKHEWNSVFLFF